MNEENLIIREVEGKGRGVFARKHFAAGELIEEAPVIVIPDPQWKELERTALKEYYFAWSDQSAAIALGFAELFNYCENPNADTVRDVEKGQMDFVALRDIEAGEEITIKYHCKPWFQVV